jgi:hypothetical protein
MSSKYQIALVEKPVSSWTEGSGIYLLKSTFHE